MGEPNAVLEAASSSKDLPPEVKIGDDMSFVSQDSSSISMPMCFLIKEHSKSVIHIQDLQKRLARVENVQDDVIDAIVEFRNYLSDSKSYNSLNPVAAMSCLSTASPATIFSKLTPSTNTNVPSTADVPHSITKTKSYSSNDLVYSEYGRSPTLVNKHFDLARCKESSPLESDKQDSGLDSDCREHQDPSLQNKHGSNSGLTATENNDELLQLLDEVSHRSVILQKQLSIVEESPALVDVPTARASQNARSYSTESNKCTQPTFGLLETLGSESSPVRYQKSKSFAATTQSHQLPESSRQAQNRRLYGIDEPKPLCDVGMTRNRSGINGIDSSVVSSILKETNSVELQRQALVYLVDNAVLHTRLREAEQTISSKNSESNKVETALKEEARLLMMENRELRISLEEQKVENKALKSRLAMLEKVVQSVTQENQELNLQLGESFNLQNSVSKRDSRNLSSSQQGSKSRRASLPEASLHCVRSKLLSNNSSFLDVTVDENPGELVVPSSFKLRNGPIHSSTPMLPLQRLRSNLNSSSVTSEVAAASPANFHSVKRCLQAKCLDGSYEVQPKTGQIAAGAYSQDGVSKFPFNSIMERLKSNSDVRLSKSEINVTSASKSVALKGVGISQPDENQTSQANSSEIVLQRKKGRNIHQRIQSILDRIVAESEDGS